MFKPWRTWRTILSFLIGACIGSPSFSTASSSLPTPFSSSTLNRSGWTAGQTLPNSLTFTLNTGEQHSLKSLNRRLVIIHFWASWCAPCLVELPAMITSLGQFHDDVAVIAVSLDTDAAAMQRTIDQLGPTRSYMHWVQDSDFALSYGAHQIQGVPETVFVSGHGEVLKIVSGEVSWEEEAIQQGIKTMIAHTVKIAP